jgi:hypothetical protein
MDRITTYTQVSYLKSFFESLDDVSLSDLLLTNPEKLEANKALYDLIFTKSNLLYDDESAFENELTKGNPWFMALFNAQNGGSQLISYPNFQYLLTDEETAFSSEPNSVHLYEKCITNKLKGHFVADSENINYLSENLTFRLEKGDIEKTTFLGWTKTFKLIDLPINSAVICDNYILHNHNKWRNNLFSILRNLFPKSLEVDFHLTIISEQKGLISNANNTIKPLFDEIRDFIVKLDLSYSVKFSLIATNGNAFHDRHIFTNYTRITPGTSFDEFYDSRNRPNKNTYVDVKCLNSEKGGTSYFKEIQQFKDIFQKANKNEVYGEKANRLLE